MPDVLSLPRSESREGRRERLLREFTLLLLLDRADDAERWLAEQWGRVKGRLVKELAEGQR